MPHDGDAAALAAHKDRLIAQGQSYRVGIVHARACVTQALRPEALLHEALEHAAGLAGARFDTWLPGGLRWQSVLPLLLPALSVIRRRKLVKPALAAACVAVALGWMLRRRQ